MRIKFKMPIIFAIAAFMLLASIDASQRPAFAQCDTVTDAEITKEIYAKLASEKSIEPQLKHIVVSTNNRVVKLIGWTDTKADHALVLKIVASVKCIKMINTQLFYEVPVPPDSPLRPSPEGCGPGMKNCGDICIPEGDKCPDGSIAVQSN